jgi:predicted PurR-regulated permease PerM
MSGPGGPNQAGAQGARSPADITRVTLQVLAIGALLGASLWIARPFIGPLIWAVMVVVASWGLMLRVQRALWGIRALAVIVMTVLLLLLFLVPLGLAVVTIADGADEMVELARKANEYHLPEKAPGWLINLPLVGGMVAKLWDQATVLGLRDLWPRLTPYAGSLTRWFVAQLGGVGFLLLQFLVTVIIAAVLYSTGENAALLVRRFARRLGGERGASVVELAGGAIRGVALGVGVTALVQALVSGVGLKLAGVPLAGLLTALTFMLCIAQIGPVPVLLPATVWVFWQGRFGWGITLVVVTLVVTMLDNVLRPLLIRMGADLSLLLIFSGVIGGLIAFGLVGIFVGPVVLAVAYTLLEAWIADGEAPPHVWRD